MTPQFNPTLYLVTQRSALRDGVDFLTNLDQALKGGVTLVQLREKDLDTGDFVKLAKDVKQVCDRYNVPLLINDRLDVHLSISSSGLHLGQSDLPLPLARSLLSSSQPQAIIGISVNTPSEARQAVTDGADYISIGPVYWTGSKKDLKEVLGVRRARECFKAVRDEEAKLGRGETPVIVIGGINHQTLPRVLNGVVLRPSSDHAAQQERGSTLAGIAVISAIVSSPDPTEAARSMRRQIESFREVLRRETFGLPRTLLEIGADAVRQEVVEGTVKLLEALREKGGGLVHHITNTVVQNDSANLTLSLSSSPLMSSTPTEMSQLSPLLSSLLLNLGTLTPDTLSAMRLAGTSANSNRLPVVIDPVGAGATPFRRSEVGKLLDEVQPAVLKGNPAEVGTVAELAGVGGSEGLKSLGVDSVGELGEEGASRLARAVARSEGCVVVMTGKTDYISDGEVVLALENGHELMGKITGSGCMTGSALACFAGLASSLSPDSQKWDEGRLVKGDMLQAAVAAVLVYTIAGEKAGEREDVRGPGTFRAALIDEIAKVGSEDVRQRARVRTVVVE